MTKSRPSLGWRNYRYQYWAICSFCGRNTERTLEIQACVFCGENDRREYIHPGEGLDGGRGPIAKGRTYAWRDRLKNRIKEKNRLRRTRNEVADSIKLPKAAPPENLRRVEKLYRVMKGFGG